MNARQSPAGLAGPDRAGSPGSPDDPGWSPTPAGAADGGAAGGEGVLGGVGVAVDLEHTSPGCSVKAAVIAMSKAIAKEAGKHEITINVVCPGFVPGDPATSGAGSIWRGEQGARFDEEILSKVARSYPLRRLGRPDDVVPAVLLLASDRAAYITGQTLSVSGGYTMI